MVYNNRFTFNYVIYSHYFYPLKLFTRLLKLLSPK